MTSKIKFHLLSSLLNIFSIILLMNIHEYIINQFIDDLFFIRASENFMMIYLIPIFLFSWLAPFSIYKFKNHRKHYLVFLIAFFLIIIIFCAYDIFSHVTKYEEYYDGRLDYIIKRSVNICIKEETLIASFLISTLIYLNQLIIGKKLLPTKYKNNKD